MRPPGGISLNERRRIFNESPIVPAHIRCVKRKILARIRYEFGKLLDFVTHEEFMSATVYLETFGCQMNVADSERADVRLRAAGFELTQSPQTADVVIFNTCSGRERAAHKVFTRIGEVRRQRIGNQPVVAVMGCVAQLEGAGVFDASPSVSVVAGTRATDRLPQLISRALEGEARVIDLD